MRAPDAFAKSRVADEVLPAQRILASDELGWRHVLARLYTDPLSPEAFTTVAVPDLLIVLVTRGKYTIESRHNGQWSSASYRPGSVAMTAPGNECTLRWRAEAGPLESLHIYLSQHMLEETIQTLGVPTRDVPDLLQVEDPFVTSACWALHHALLTQAPSLYPDSVSQALTTYLLYKEVRQPDSPPSSRLGDRTLGSVREYMIVHLSEDVSLDQLAGVANCSKFHFLRQFKTATGMTPHRYLVDLRMTTAAELLRHTDYPIPRVAHSVGYSSLGQFAASFRRQHSVTPLQFRRQGS